MAVTFSNECTCIILPNLTDELRRRLYYTKAEIRQFKKDSARDRKEARKLAKMKLESEVVGSNSETDESSSGSFSSDESKGPASPSTPPMLRESPKKSARKSHKGSKGTVKVSKEKLLTIAKPPLHSKQLKVQNIQPDAAVEIGCLPRRAMKAQSHAQHFIRARLCI
jgi:hypothetical protein